jgi:hypothetical protein
MSYIQNTHRCRGFKLTFADWLKFSLIEEKLIKLLQICHILFIVFFLLSSKNIISFFHNLFVKGDAGEVAYMSQLCYNIFVVTGFEFE